MVDPTSFKETSSGFGVLVRSLQTEACRLPFATTDELAAVTQRAQKEVAALRRDLEYSFVTVSGGRKLRAVEHEALRAFARANRLGEDVVFGSVEINDAGRVTQGRFTENQVTGISALAGLTALTLLYLNGTEVSDVSPVTRPGLSVVR